MEGSSIRIVSVFESGGKIEILMIEDSVKMARGFMAPSQFASLRVRLIILVLLAVIPALGITLYSGFERRGYERQRLLEDASQLALEISKTQEHLIRHGRQILFTLSRTPQVQQQDKVACSKISAALRRQFENYTGLLAAKPNGDVFANDSS
jgi:hypothetical protein